MFRGFLIFILLFTTSIHAQVMDWGCLPQSPGDQVTSFTEYNTKLIVTGSFSTVGSVQANLIASWDGSSWNQLGSGLRGPSGSFAYESVVNNNELFVVGTFDSAGTVKAKNIAKWDGSNWTGLATSGNGIIYSAAFYNNELYVGGTFTNIDGMSANHIAKWNGSNWQALGSGINGSNVNDLYVYQNELYVLGTINSAGGVPCNGIARWNGTSWDSVMGGVSTTNASMIEWQGKLLVGSQYYTNFTITPGPQIQSRVQQWNGTAWSIFSQQETINVRKFAIHNNNLYFSGGITNSLTPEYSNVMKWNSLSSLWEYVGSGINHYTPALGTYNSELLCGGVFNTAQSGKCDYLAKLVDVTSLNDLSQINNEIIVYPNPCASKIYLEGNWSLNQTQITITTLTGQNVLQQSFSNEIDILSLYQGIYIVNITGNGISINRKIIVYR
ncbi:MAG: hypothetical protein K0S32_2856 [Bacteroidetes bacterium]|jgi:hypothetical protein|nr:hypothetical protein [Bacteroidota bacterium]